MYVRLKKLHDQVMVITGASSGIGLATARMAAREGAKVVLACRNQQALDEIVASIRTEGGDAWLCRPTSAWRPTMIAS